MVTISASLSTAASRLHNSCRHDRDILCDQPGIEAIILGQDAAGAGELTKFVGVDASHRQARGQQGSDDAALVTATRIDRPRSRSTNWLQPAAVLSTEKHRPCGSTCTSRRSFDTSIPP